MNRSGYSLNEYWQKVIKEASKKTFQKLGFWSRILAISVSVLAGILNGYINGGSVKESFMVFFITILVWVCVWFTCFLYFFIIEPVIIHNTLLDEVERLENEFNPENPIEIFLRSPEFPKQGRVNVGIDIYNTSSYTVDFTVSVIFGGMQKPEVLVPISMHTGIVENTNIRLFRKTTIPFYFACSQVGWENAIINVMSDNHRRMVPGEYELTISIDGESSTGKSISNSNKFLLIYKGEDSLFLKTSNL